MQVHVQGEEMIAFTLNSILGKLGWYSNSRSVILICSLQIYERQVLAGLREGAQKPEEDI